MKLNKIFIIIALVGLFGFMTACGSQNNEKDNNQEAQNNNEEVQDNNQESENNVNESGFPIVDDEITLEFFSGEAPGSPDWNDDFSVWVEYEDMTNIKIDWVEQVLGGDIAEKRSLALAGGDLPDVFYTTEMGSGDLLKYGEQGTFIDLKDLIDDYAPNLTKLFEENPDIESGLTFPDGNMYSLPNIKDRDFVSMNIGAKPWIDETWLERLDMEIPETTEEFYDFLTAVKEEEPDTFPFGASGMDYILNNIKGSFGLMNTGKASEIVDLDPDGNGLRFIPTADKYREMLEYMHKLFDEGLISPNIFSMEWNQFLSDAGEGNYASVIFWNPGNSIGGENSENFVSFFPLEGPDGDQLYTGIASPLSVGGQFVITNENEYPAETVRWIDYFYGDEGSKLMFIGLEGDAFVEEDGEYRYSDAVLEGEGRPVDNAKQLAPGIGLNTPALVKEDYFVGSESMPDSLEAADRLSSYVPEEIWPPFTYTKEENDFMNAAGNDINKFVEEKRDQFIAGDESLDDENWEKYIETLEGMELEEYMKIEEAAYERFSNN